MDELARYFSEAENDPRVQDVLRRACAVTGMRFAAVAYVSHDRWICCQVEDDLSFGLAPGGELDVRKTICDEVRGYGKSIWFDDCREDPDWWNHPVPTLYGFRSYFALPIELEEGHFFGTLCGLDPEPRTVSIGPSLPILQSLALEVGHLMFARGIHLRVSAIAAAEAGKEPA